MKSLIASIVCAVACWTGSAQAGEITVAAAADLSFALKEAAAVFERQSGIHVNLSLGSSGNFYSQIQNGAPFDLFLSADVRYPQMLAEGGLALPGTLHRYAIGRLVLWVPHRTGLPSPEGGLPILTDSAIRKIAIANPKHAPYGRAVVEALQHEGLYEAVKDKLVLGENISQAAQFVHSGAADVGLIALSLAMAPAMQRAGRYWEVPQTAHATLEQGAVVLKNGANRDGAQALLAFLKSPDGQALFRRYGFIVPGAAKP